MNILNLERKNFDFFDVILRVPKGLASFYAWRILQMLLGLLHIHGPKVVFEAGMTHTSELTLEYMAPLSTSPLRIQMMDAAGLALSAWQVRLRGSPARRLTTGPPLMTGFSGGTENKERGHTFSKLQWDLCGVSHHIQSGWYQSLLLFVCTCSSSLTFFKCGEYKRGRSVVIFFFFFFLLEIAAFDVSCIWLCFSAFDSGLFFLCHSPSRNLFNPEKWHWNISWRLSFSFTLIPSDFLKCVYELNDYIQGKEFTVHRHKFSCICIHQAWLSQQHWLLL